MVKTGDCSSLRLRPSADGPRSGFSRRPAPRPVCRATLGVNLPLAFLRSQLKFSQTPAFAWATPSGLNEGRRKIRTLHQNREGCGTQAHPIQKVCAWPAPLELFLALDIASWLAFFAPVGIVTQLSRCEPVAKRP